MALPDGVTIRQATPEDAEALTRLHLDVWDDAYTDLMPQETLDLRRSEQPTRVERWRRTLEESDPPTYVAEDADDLVGFVTAGRGRDNDVDTDLELWALYVRARYYGTGVGYALFEHTVGDRAAYLWVLAGNDRSKSEIATVKVRDGALNVDGVMAVIGARITFNVAGEDDRGGDTNEMPRLNVTGSLAIGGYRCRLRVSAAVGAGDGGCALYGGALGGCVDPARLGVIDQLCSGE